MNAIDLAELTTALAQRGLHRELRIHASGSRPNNPVLVLDVKGNAVASISATTGNSGYVAYDTRIQGYHGATRAEALGKLLNEHAKRQLAHE